MFYIYSPNITLFNIGIGMEIGKCKYHVTITIITIILLLLLLHYTITCNICIIMCSGKNNHLFSNLSLRRDKTVLINGSRKK